MRHSRTKTWFLYFKCIAVWCSSFVFYVFVSDTLFVRCVLFSLIFSLQCVSLSSCCILYLFVTVGCQIFQLLSWIFPVMQKSADSVKNLGFFKVFWAFLWFTGSYCNGVYTYLGNIFLYPRSLYRAMSGSPCNFSVDTYRWAVVKDSMLNTALCTR